MVDRVQRRPGGRNARIRESVIAAVRRALESGDSDALSVERLAGAASVHRSTIYRRWPTTDALVAELLRSLTPIETPLPDTGALADDLLALVVRVASTISEPLVETTLRIAAASTDPDLRGAAADYWDGVLDRSSEIVRRGQARGEASTAIDPTDAVESLLAPLYFRLLVTRRPLNTADVHSVAQRTTRMLIPEPSDGRNGA